MIIFRVFLAYDHVIDYSYCPRITRMRAGLGCQCQRIHVDDYPLVPFGGKM